MSSSELTITGFNRDQWITCQDPYKIASVKRYFAPENPNARSFVEYLERTNRVCSQTFALFIPVNVTSFSDVVCPWTVHYALGSDKKGFSKYAYVGGSLLADLITLVFRLVILIPRGVYKCTQVRAIRLAHPICCTLTTGMDNDLPIKVNHNNKEFYFALDSMHEIQARRYFTRASESVASSINKYCKDYNKHFENNEETNSNKEYDNYGPLAFKSPEGRSVIISYSSTACVGHLRTFLHFNYGYSLSMQIVFGGKVLKDDEVLSQKKSKGSTLKVDLLKTT